MVSFTSFKSSSIEHDVHFVNYGSMYLKIDNKSAYALGWGYLVTDMLLPLQAVMSCSAVRFMEVVLKDTPSCK